MFHKLDQWLLTRYPLLWNMRLHILLPLIIVVHVLFYISGYFNPVSLHTLNRYNVFSEDGSVQAMAALLAVLIMVLWLVFYLRNNAFKNFYPLKKGRLFAEYLLLVLIVLGLSTFSVSWNKGLRDHVRALTHDTDLKKEAETTNLAMHFIPFSQDDFDIESCCDSVLKHSDTPRRERANVAADTMPHKHSFLYYCDKEISYLNTEKLKDEFEIDETAKRWLLNNKQDSVKWIMDEYLKLCDKYGAQYDFNTAEEAKACFTTPDFRVEHYIDEGHYDREDKETFIERRDVFNSLERIDDVRDRSWDYKEIIAFLYFGICAALLIFSFRTTKLRTWFIAAIGTGLWAMFFGLLAAMARGNESLIIFLFLTLAVIFFLYACWNIITRKLKLSSGLCFLWFLWALPALVPLFFVFLQKSFFRADRYRYDQAGNSEYIGPDPRYEWIETHWTHISVANLILVVIMVALVLIPLMRKWQANPEE